MTKKEMQNVRGTLRAAKSVIKNSGWIQGELYDGTGAVCALGALQEVGVDGIDCPMENATLFALDTAVRRHTKKAIDIPDWNDAKRRNVDQVLAMFDFAIELSKNPTTFRKFDKEREIEAASNNEDYGW